MTKEIVILCHVDNFLALGKSNTEIKEVLEEVSKKIKLQDLGEVSTFLGIEFSLEREEPGHKVPISPKGLTKSYKSIKLYQTKYVKYMLKRFGKEHLTPISTPIQEGVKLQKATSDPFKEDLNLYQ